MQAYLYAALTWASPFAAIGSPTATSAVSTDGAQVVSLRIVPVGARGRIATSLALNAQVGHGRTTTLAGGAVLLAHPQVAWIGPNRALAVWVGSRASPRQLTDVRAELRARRGAAALNLLLSTQDLFYATWDGQRWSKVAQLTHDGKADDEPSLVADPLHHTALLLWVHATTSHPFGDLGHAMELETSTYVNDGWSTPSVVPGTAGQGVRAPRLAGGVGDVVAAAWIQGPLENGRAVLAHWLGNRWSKARPVDGLPRGAQALISLALDTAGRAVLTEAALAAVPPYKASVMLGVPTIWVAYG
jgi:hypothetical protein